MFIDEGFATLDGESLDLAIEPLTELNVEGRLVGIISHVEALKGHIATRLDVRTEPEGSTTNFVTQHERTVEPTIAPSAPISSPPEASGRLEFLL